MRQTGYYFVKLNGENKIAEATEFGTLIIDGVIVGAPLPTLHPTPITPEKMAAIEAIIELSQDYELQDFTGRGVLNKIKDTLTKHKLI